MSVAPPSSYVNPCDLEKSVSTESEWRTTSDLGECYFRNSNSILSPVLIPVYNGKALNLQHEFVHASLAGISIKHYYGKCFQDIDIQDDDETFADKQSGSYRFTMMGEGDPNLSPLNDIPFPDKFESSHTDSSSSGSFDYREEIYVEGQPLCIVPRINHRNSFWNLHRPELCKLTWAQNYVGPSTVIEHLHEHLISHGPLCMNFHTVEDRANMLKAELDEFVRLKILAKPRDLPPDEPIFSLHEPDVNTRTLENKKCKTITGRAERKPVREPSVRFIHVNDDEDEMEGLRVRASKEEFCITIGKPIRKPAITPSISGEEITFPGESLYAASEEGHELFYYNWYLYTGEESYEEYADEKCESSTENSDVEPRDETCPPLIMDEFCRAAGKVDLSDLRCNPDDF